MHYYVISTGHPNCKVFITHGGLNSIQEAIYHGVPVLGLPFGLDHEVNLGRVVKEGYGVVLAWKNLNVETLEGAINTLLHDPRYKLNCIIFLSISYIRIEM